MSVQGSTGDWTDERERLRAAFKDGEKAIMSMAPKDVWDSAMWMALDDLRRQIGVMQERVARHAAQHERVVDAASWLLKCQADIERRVPVRNFDEAWAGLRAAVRDSDA